MHHIVRRLTDTEVRLLATIVMRVEPGSLLLPDVSGQHNVFKMYWPIARADRFTL